MSTVDFFGLIPSKASKLWTLWESLGSRTGEYVGANNIESEVHAAVRAALHASEAVFSERIIHGSPIPALTFLKGI